MREVAIIGAGELGGALAHVLARLDLVRTIRLIDEAGATAAGMALDITQASPIEGFTTEVSGATDLTRSAGADVMFIADRASGGEWQGEEGLALLRRVSQLGGVRVLLCVGASHRELIERGVGELGYERRRLFGSAPEALASAVRAIVALETNGSPDDVAMTLLGIPPARIVVPWEEATIGGFAATRVLDEPARRRIAARIAPLWPPGPYALAWAAAKALGALTGRSRRILAAFVAPDDANRRRSRAAAMPVRLGAAGIERVESLSLNVHDRVEFENATLL